MAGSFLASFLHRLLYQSAYPGQRDQANMLLVGMLVVVVLFYANQAALLVQI